MPEAPQHKSHDHNFLSRALLALSAVGLGWLSGCSTPPSGKPGAGPATSQVPSSPSQPTATRPEAAPQAVTPAVTPATPASGPIKSTARNARDYRKDAASHLYARHSQHIYKGRLPPMLEAVGVLNVDIDRHGSVKSVQWMRAPGMRPRSCNKSNAWSKPQRPTPCPST